MVEKMTMFLFLLILGGQNVTTNTLQISETSMVCPKVDIHASEKSAKEPIIFEVKFKDFKQFNTMNKSNDLIFNWTTSRGTIISGQGTKIIKVKRDGLRGQIITASVEITGLDDKCANIKDHKHQVEY